MNRRSFFSVAGLASLLPWVKADPEPEPEPEPEVITFQGIPLEYRELEDREEVYARYVRERTRREKALAQQWLDGVENYLWGKDMALTDEELGL